MIFINRNGLLWRDAPSDHGPHKTLYSRWKRWSDKGIFARMLLELAGQGGETNTLIIDATHLKAHRITSSQGLKKGGEEAGELDNVLFLEKAAAPDWKGNS